MPKKGFVSVNLPFEQHRKVKVLIKRRPDLGYRSIAEFVREAVRKRFEEIVVLDGIRQSLRQNEQIKKLESAKN